MESGLVLGAEEMKHPAITAVATGTAPKRFKKIYLEISNICNLKCSFCPAVERGEQQIAKEILRQRLIKVKPWAERVCLHVMGEPLAHPEFPDFIAVARELGVDIEITTNGTLLSEENRRALLDPCVKQVNFSLQSFTDNFPKANPLGYFHKILHFVRQSLLQRPDLYINFRLWNIGDALASRDTEFFLQQIELEFDAQINRNVDVGFKKSKKICARVYVHFDSRFEWPDMKKPELTRQGRCLGGDLHVAVLTDGTVVPCCLDKEASIDLGHLDSQEFMDIIESPRAQQLRQGFSTGRRVEDLCARCGFAQRFSKN